MSPLVTALSVAVALFFGLLLCVELGYRWGMAVASREREGAGAGLGPIEGAIFGLLGLLLALSVSGAAGRLENRRSLVVDEANAMGTAWLRLDLLPPESQPRVRDLFRRYVDSRLAVYAKLPDIQAAEAEVVKGSALQGQIWTAAVEACRPAEIAPVRVLVLPALNEMFDIATTRVRAAYVHTSPVITGYLVLLALLSAAVGGRAMSERKRRPASHGVLFALILAATVYVIIDLDHPRFGLIRIDADDRVLVDVRASMR
jgi:hypothetical protein